MIGWIVANWGTLVEVLVTLVTAGTLITGLTPSPEDDKVMSKIRNFVGRFASITTYADAPGTFKLPCQDACSVEPPLVIHTKAR